MIGFTLNDVRLDSLGSSKWKKVFFLERKQNKWLLRNQLRVFPTQFYKVWRNRREKVASQAKEEIKSAPLLPKSMLVSAPR